MSKYTLLFAVFLAVPSHADDSKPAENADVKDASLSGVDLGAVQGKAVGLKGRIAERKKARKDQAAGKTNGMTAKEKAESDFARNGVETLQKTGLKMADLYALGYTADNIIDLGNSISEASKGIKQLHQKNPSAVGDAYSSGTMTNLEDTAKKWFSDGKLQRGCVAHQRATKEAIAKLQNRPKFSMEVKGIVVYQPLPHHAVVLYPKGAAKEWRKKGIVLDAWKTQSPDVKKMTYTYDDWDGFWQVNANLE